VPAAATFDATHTQREFNVLPNRHVPKQGVVLKHQTDARFAGAQMRHVATVEGNASVVDVGQSGCDAQQRTLATAAGSEKHEELAGLNLQGASLTTGVPL
jgi:hypothetical protein